MGPTIWQKNSSPCKINKIWAQIKNICWAVSEAIENAAEGGGSVDIMNERVDSLDELIGMDVFEDEFLGTSYDYPMNIKNMILSDKVFIKK